MADDPPFNRPPVNSLAGLIEWCQHAGVDPYPIMADELRAMGWTVEEPDAR